NRDIARPGRVAAEAPHPGLEPRECVRGESGAFEAQTLQPSFFRRATPRTPLSKECPMTRRTRLLGVALGAMSGALMAQQATSSKWTTTTTTPAQTVTGSVVQYSPGQTIVVQGADGKATTYTLGPSLSVPADVSIGRSVTLSTEPGAKSGQSV